MIVLYTDFGLGGPYLGQMKAVLLRHAPEIPLLDLFADAPVHNIRANAYLLAAYSAAFEAGTVFLAVVDPGVGSDDRAPVVVKCDGCWFVGPDNGLFDVVTLRAGHREKWTIKWRPPQLSSSFHGRDLFAPVAAMLATGAQPELQSVDFDKKRLAQWPDDLFEIIYIDHFGNLISGIRASSVNENATLRYRGQSIPRGNTFADAPVASPLCYENSSGLLEIAVNQGRADHFFDAQIGDLLEIQDVAN